MDEKQTKRHHYVPKAYLRAFCDDSGRIRVYLKGDPVKTLHQDPDKTGFERYYYSQPLPGGGTDNNTLEALFSDVESKWPAIVARLRRKENINDALEDLFAFIALQKVRVPAARDAHELVLAAEMRSAAKRAIHAGLAPPPPAGFENLLETLQIAIDPHTSIHAMPGAMQEVAEVLQRVGLVALHNPTDTPFLTSDNPVIWLNPVVRATETRPYELEREGAVVFIFPVAPDLLLYGDSSMRDAFATEGLSHSDFPDREYIETINREISRFAYRVVFSRNAVASPTVQQFGDLCPTVESTVLNAGTASETVVHRNAFANRPSKIKW